ncbi:MAG: ribonuclease HII [Myxococcales bacterium]|nr:ribonuclease HII [Myxococcales bacterium]MCB9545111.1 ribonuclease HII [Myxococcales bacterium]
MRRGRSAQPTLFADDPPDGPLGAIEGWLTSTGRRPALGVDEVGRGPLAGPVVAAAVVLPPEIPSDLADLNDSKQLSEATRERLFDALQVHALAIGVGEVDAAGIDAINILQATRVAMRQAIDQAVAALGRPPAALLVDGHLRLPGWSGPQWALVKGDGRSLHIAAASVIAKVIRDRFMAAQDALYPVYGFGRHKGYGTKEHRAALAAHGPCPLHRASFRWTPPADG